MLQTTRMIEPVHDVLIVGGGLVGSSLACALEGSGLRVVLAEASDGVAAAAPSFDERNLALARASVNALAAIGVWRHLASGASPIERIHISSKGDFGAVRLAAKDRDLDAFGAVVVARELGAALEKRLGELAGLQRHRATRVTALEPHPDHVVATLQRGTNGMSVACRLVVAADGTESSLRTLLGIGVQRHDYAQTLFVATVQPERAHVQTAYERFTDSGPVALLPLSGARMGSICTVPSARAAAVAALDDEGYAEFLQQRFGWRMGRLLRVGKRSAYPLHRVCADVLVAPRAVLVGNAAQTIHPVGAQGFNLGLRDALTLAEELIDGARQRLDPGAATLLQRHAQRRQADRDATIAFSDGLVRLFSQPFAPLRALRSLGLFALDTIPGLDARLVAGAMGFRGDVPRLALADGG
jgi:2-octaprenyl-6-methoxyphenol hydroxylase